MNKTWFEKNEDIISFTVAVVIGVSIFFWFLTAIFSKAHAMTPSEWVVLETNVNRTINHEGILAENPILDRAAREKANDMAKRNYFSHNTPDGKTPWTFFTENNYSFTSAGENLAVSYRPDYDIMASWMNSPTHRQNILNEKYIDIGIGIATGTYNGWPATFTVQFFGKPKTSSYVTSSTVTSPDVLGAR